MLNGLVRTAYRAAHLGLRAVWFIRKPETSGSLVAAWRNDRILVVRNSYRSQLTLPGGYVRPKEDRRTAAARELREEVGLTVQPKRLVHAYHGTHVFEHRKDTLDIFEFELDSDPEIQIDRREVIWAGFLTRHETLERNIVPHLQEYLDSRAAKTRSAA